jgi:hypothetical protein
MQNDMVIFLKGENLPLPLNAFYSARVFALSFRKQALRTCRPERSEPFPSRCSKVASARDAKFSSRCPWVMVYRSHSFMGRNISPSQ